MGLSVGRRYRGIVGALDATELYLTVTVVGALIFEILYLLGYGGGQTPLFYTLLYAFNLAVIATGAALLMRTYVRRGDLLVLLTGVAVLSWFLGSLFFVSYVFLLGEVLPYPSVAQFAFHSFHLLMIPVVLYVMEQRDVRFRSVALVPVGAAPLLSMTVYFAVDVGVLLAVYNAFYLTVVVATCVLAAHLVYDRVFSLYGSALLLFFVADIRFIISTFFQRTQFSFSLDPIWFTAHALVAFSIVRYARQDRLPSVSSR